MCVCFVMQVARVLARLDGASVDIVGGEAVELNACPATVPVCKHFTKSGVCSYGPGCLFRHPPRPPGLSSRRCGAPTTWTILQQDGPNHLGLWYNVLPEHQQALITSVCVPFKWWGGGGTTTSVHAVGGERCLQLRSELHLQAPAAAAELIGAAVGSIHAAHSASFFDGPHSALFFDGQCVEKSGQARCELRSALRQD